MFDQIRLLLRMVSPVNRKEAPSQTTALRILSGFPSVRDGRQLLLERLVAILVEEKKPKETDGDDEVITEADETEEEGMSEVSMVTICSFIYRRYNMYAPI